MSDTSDQLRYASYSLPSSGPWIERDGESFPNNVCSQAADELDRMEAQIDQMRGLLLWTLYHHQGGSSDIGQPIRRALGIGRHNQLTPAQIEAAKASAVE